MTHDEAPAPGAGSGPADARDRFCGPGEMRARSRALDWGATPLGPVDGWASSLRTTAETVLAMGFPANLLWGPDLVQIYNDAYIPFLGVKHPAALGMPAHAWWPEVWSFVEPIFARVRAGETVTFADQPFPLRRRGPDAAAEEVYITLTYVPVRDERGVVGGVLVTGIDTTAQVTRSAAQADRQHMEAQLHGVLLETALLLDQVSDAYVVLDGALHIVGANQSAERTLGIERAALIGRSHAEVFPASGDDAPARHYRHVATAGVDAHFVHHFVGDGYDLHLEIDAYPARDGGVHVFWRDISERLRLLATAEGARADAEAANRAKGEFLATMSHELRTPLNAIGGYAELIEMGIRGPVTPQQREDLARIQKSQRHLLGLINGVLNYARAEAGAMQYAVGDVPLVALLATSEALVAPQARAKRIALHFDPCDAALVVRADEEKLQQIVLNLLSNAVKFTEPGGAVTLACTRGFDIDAQASAVRVRVSDTGRGIAADSLGRVFDAFVQVDARLTRTQEGIGLGLTISRDLARGMGGDLTATSEVEVGSTFTLTLPAA